MAKIVVKLFRDPRDAEAALEGLKKQGFKEEEIGVLARLNGHTIFSTSPEKIAFPGIGDVATQGPLQKSLKEASSEPEKPPLAAALSKALELSIDATNYFEFGISMGAVLLTVHAEDAKAQQAREVFRSIGAVSARIEPQNTTPGFNVAGRMSATDPIDAPMSGDFRKY